MLPLPYDYYHVLSLCNSPTRDSIPSSHLQISVLVILHEHARSTRRLLTFISSHSAQVLFYCLQIKQRSRSAFPICTLPDQDRPVASCKPAARIPTVPPYRAKSSSNHFSCHSLSRILGLSPSKNKPPPEHAPLLPQRFYLITTKQPSVSSDATTIGRLH